MPLDRKSITDYTWKADLLKSVTDLGSFFLLDFLNERATHRFTSAGKSEELFEVANILAIKGRYYFNEIIVDGARRKPYLDLERVFKTKKIFDQKYKKTVRKLQADIITVFKNKYNHEISKADIKLLDSSGPSKGGWKISLHVIISPVDRTLYYTKSKHSDSASYDFYTSLMQLDPNYSKLLDDQVYNKSVNMRMIGSAKTFDDNRTLGPIDPVTLKPIVLSDKLKLDYMLSYVDAVKPSHQLKTPVTEQTVHPRQKVAHNNPRSTDCNKKLLKLVTKYHPTAVYQGLSGDSKTGMIFHNFDYTNRKEPCPVSGRLHDSNRFFCYETDCGLYLRCHSSHCKDRLHLGYLDDSNELIDNAIQIDNQYLLKHTEMPQIIDNWAKDQFILAIKSAMGTGKTHTLKYILNKYKFKKVLWITHRQTLTKNICGSFKGYGFVNYMDDKSKLFHADRAIVQVDSLQHVTEYCMADACSSFNKYDLVIIDEVEGCLSHFSSPFLTNTERTAKDVFDLMLRIMRHSQKIILLDADLGVRTGLLLDHLTETKDSTSAVVVNNNYMPMQKSFMITNDGESFDRDLFDDLKAGLNVCVVSMSAGVLDPYEKQLFKEGYRYVAHKAKSDDKLKDELENVNEFWVKYQVVLYSPTIESGVDFNVEHFDRIYAVIADGPLTCSQRSFLQMIGRIRKIKNYVIPCLYYNIPMPNDLEPKLDAAVYTFDDMLDYFRWFETLNGRKILHNVKFVDVDCGGVIKQVRIQEDVELFDKISMYNEVERLNKHPAIFATVLARLVAKAGHKIRFNLVVRVPVLKMRVFREKAEVTRENLITRLVSIKESKHNIPDLHKKQSKSKLSGIEKEVLQVYHFRKNFGIDADADNKKELFGAFWGKEMYLRRFELLFGYRELDNSRDDTMEVGKERSRLTIILDLVNRLLRRPRNKRITKLRPRHVRSITLTQAQYDLAINDIINNSIYFRNESKSISLFNKRKGSNKKTKNERIRCIPIIQGLLKSYNICLLSGKRKRVKGKRVCVYSLSANTRMAAVVKAKHKKPDAERGDIDIDIEALG